MTLFVQGLQKAAILSYGLQKLQKNVSDSFLISFGKISWYVINPVSPMFYSYFLHLFLLFNTILVVGTLEKINS